MTASSLVRIARTLCILSLLAAGTASAAPQTRDQRTCTVAMNGALAGVSAAAASDLVACAADASKGKLATTIEACVLADRKGKVAKAADKTSSAFVKQCTGSSRKPAGVPRKPSYGVTDAPTVTAAASDEGRALLRDVLGADLDAGVLREADGKAAVRCQQQVTKDLRGCHAALLREFNACKKRGLADKTAPFDDAADLAACFAADPKGKIAKRCDRRVEVRPGKLDLDSMRKGIESRCTTKGVALSQALPGCATGDAGAAHACLERAARCRTCRALAAGDALDLDCDALDDGVANASCAAPLGTFACTLSDDSSFLFESSAGFTGGGIGGTVEVACGVRDAATGFAPCACALTAVEPVDVPGGGVACIEPIAGCATGSIDCAGGSSQDFALWSDHDVGVCTSNAGCATLCDGLCTASGAARWGGGCEGYCDGGSANEAACTSDAQCPGGRCSGIAGGGHGNVCQCQCIEYDGGVSDPGGLRCEVGMRVRVEAALPCDGTDVLIDIGERCVPITTENAQALLGDQDLVPGKVLPAGFDLIGGTARTCDALRSSGASGMILVSTINEFDLPLVGDVYLLLGLGCQ